MSDSSPRRQRSSLHNFNLPDDLKWERTRSQGSNVNERHGRHAHSRLHRRHRSPTSLATSDSRRPHRHISEYGDVLPQSAPEVEEWPKWIGENLVAQDGRILRRCPLPYGEEILHRDSEGSITHTPSRTSSHHRQSSGETLHRDSGYLSSKPPLLSRISSHQSSRETSHGDSSWSSKSLYQSSSGGSRPARVPSHDHQSSRRTPPRDSGGRYSRPYVPSDGQSRQTTFRDAGVISRSSSIPLNRYGHNSPRETQVQPAGMKVLMSPSQLPISTGEAYVESSNMIFTSPHPLSRDASISAAENPPDFHIKISNSSGAPSQMWSSHDSCHHDSQMLNKGFTEDNDEDDKNTTNSNFRKAGFKPSKEWPIKKLDKAFSPVKMDDKHDDGEDEFAKEKNISEIMKEKMSYEDSEGKSYKREEMPIKTYVRCSRKEGGQRNEEKKLETLLLPMKKRRDEVKYKSMDEDGDPNDLNVKILNLKDTKPNHSDLHHDLNLDKNNSNPSTKDKWEYLKEPNYKQIAGTKGEEFKNSGNKRNSDQVLNKDEEQNKKNGADVEKKKDDEKKKEEGKGKGKEPLKKRKNDQLEDEDEEEEEKVKELKIPKVNVQLAPHEIAEDLFALGVGSRPQRKHPSSRRTPRVQRDIDQVTPGMWLGEIEMDRYKVPSESASKV
ncbi:OLC1v1038579C1 [Oldenlandia corymbosa var. corymbosa]|uniref:OLC1v1038579C1 n=1 Tax=Oldenlandia corymbosa var. corymbosa TaxID=529605 RepID=A0AAV1D0Q8_OLDCO|nr:OLC1v1038579C1 [Oldenlandia corymbosa var. corymbosa]